MPSPPKTGTNLRHPRPPQSLTDSEDGSSGRAGQHGVGLAVKESTVLKAPPYRVSRPKTSELNLHKAAGAHFHLKISYHA